MRKQWKFIAMYMILLVITIPIMSASALSSSISITEYYGEDGVEGFIAEEDSLYVGAEIDWDEETFDEETNITSGELFSENYVSVLWDGEEYSFASCTGEGPYNCIFQSDTAVREGMLEIVVNLYDTSIILIEEDSEIVYVDDLAPEIDDLEIPSVVINDFNVTYEITDEACDTCLSECSGISYVEFLINDESREVIEISNENDTSSICNTEGIIETNTDDLVNGEVEACFKVVDRSCSIMKCK